MAHNIRCLVVLMLENRSFDQMVGYAHHDAKGVIMQNPKHGKTEIGQLQPVSPVVTQRAHRRPRLARRAGTSRDMAGTGAHCLGEFREESLETFASGACRGYWRDGRLP